MIYHSRSPRETEKIAGEFVKKLKKGEVVGLFGDLGAGKTVFVKGMAKGLGIDSRYYVNSPTFTLVNDYGPILHLDLYRIERPEELETLGLDDYVDKIVVIEWADKFQKRLDFRVRIENISDKERIIEIV